MTKYVGYKLKYLQLRNILINRTVDYERKQLRLLKEVLLESQCDYTSLQQENIKHKLNEMQYNQGTIDELNHIINKELKS